MYNYQASAYTDEVSFNFCECGYYIPLQYDQDEDHARQEIKETLKVLGVL